MDPQLNQSFKKPKGRKGSRQNQNQQNGGAGAPDHMSNVVGNISAQHAQIGRGNEIATAVSGQNPDLGSSLFAGNGLYSGSSLLASASLFKGGKKRSGSSKKRKGKRKGGNLLSTLAVPAMYLYANNTFGKRRSSSSGRKTRRFRRSRRSGRR